MSISKVHDLLQNKGCVWFVSILMIVGVAASSFWSCNKGNAMSRDMTGVGQAAPVAQVGNFVITDRLISSEMEAAARMYGGSVENLPPDFQIQVQGGAVSSIVGYCYMLELGKKYGVETNDDEIIRMIESGITDQINQFKQQLVSQKVLKENATEAEFASEFKKRSGKDIAEVKQQMLDENKKRLDEPDLRIPLAAMSLNQPLMDAIRKSIKVTDEDIKKSYDNFDFKKITVNKGDVEAVAKKALAEIKGGLAFETAMSRYSNDTPEKGKKISDTTTTIGRSTLEGFDIYKPLASLKPGEVSDLIKTGSTVSIYKLLSIKSSLPKDFDAKKDTYRDSVLTSKAAARLQSELADMQKAGNVQWKNDNYRLLFEYGRMSSEGLSPDAQNAKLKTILTDSLKAANSENPIGARISHLIAYAVFNQLYQKASPAEKSKMNDQKVEVYQGYLMDHEDVALRLDLAEVFKEQKKKDDFYSELMAAANANSSSLDAAGQNNFQRINKILKDGKDAKLLSEDDGKAIQSVLDDWKKQKIDQDKYDAEAKKIEEKARKDAEAADKAATKKAANEVKTRDEVNKEKAGKK